jgi:hypothetical protein
MSYRQILLGIHLSYVCCWKIQNNDIRYSSVYRLLNVCRRIYLSDGCLYSYYEQGMYNMYDMCCWD